ncbi:hypothetical protein THAOC_36909 [Thalassiosira oceanica]|uniref:Uncharacterized protein n=1 Tax=Thalassiosira oceanica TaxID=159749 RepID=K0QZF0_THAOC|nr:hypothetical protein THAOC_36909 [Thalassiosira oceanica]|eukprot:EJK44540.1 hypothetical protein THAOC_36909 [Thalassiosira oceanica]
METTTTVKTNLEPKGTLDTSETSQTSAGSLASSICGESSIATRSILEELCSDLSSRSLCKELRRNSSSHGDIAVLAPDMTVGFGCNDKTKNSHTSKRRDSHTSLASLDDFVSSMAKLSRSRKSPPTPTTSTPANQTDPSFPSPSSPQIQGNELPFRPSRRRSLSLGDKPTCAEELRPQSRIMSEYEIGEEVRSTSDLSVDIKTIRNLNEGGGAFIKRSDGSFTFAVVKRRCVEIVSGFRESKEEMLVFFVDPSRKMVKVINEKKWSSSIIGVADHVFEKMHG